MKFDRNKTKAAAALFSTLLLGAFLGAAVLGYIYNLRIQEYRNFTSGKTFTIQILNVIPKLKEQQRKALVPILEQYGQRIATTIRTARFEVQEDFDELELTMANHLTETQLLAFRVARRKTDEELSRYDGDQTVE